MRILLISLLLLIFVGCAHSNFAWHYPALYYNDGKTLADKNSQQYLVDLNSLPSVNGGLHYTTPYTLLDW